MIEINDVYWRVTRDSKKIKTTAKVVGIDLIWKKVTIEYSYASHSDIYRESMRIQDFLLIYPNKESPAESK